MPFISFTGLDGSSEPVGLAIQYLNGVSTALRTNAARRGLKEYLGVIRAAAMASAPDGFRTAAGYLSSVHPTRGGTVTGYLFSRYPGNVLEAGFVDHYAPLQDAVDKDGNVARGLIGWLQRNHPELLPGKQSGRSARFIHVKARAGTPWVIPSAERVAAQAEDAFLSGVLDELGKVN